MKSEQTIFIAADGKASTDESAGPFPARLLVNAGKEISDAKLDQHPGARELAEGKGKKVPKEAAEKVIETREPKVEHRDPSHVAHKGKK